MAEPEEGYSMTEKQAGFIICALVYIAVIMIFMHFDLALIASRLAK